MTTDVELSKRTHITDAHNINGEIPEEIHNLQALRSQVENQNQRCNQRTEKLLQKEYLQQRR